MKSYLVTYSCHPDYDDSVVKVIRSFPFWARINPKAWIIQSDKNTIEIRNQIKQNLSGLESVLVISIDGASWATSSVNKDVTDWMTDNL